jgi:polyphosphate glucokinase
MTDEIGTAMNRNVQVNQGVQKTVLAIDMGGSHVKVSLSTDETKRAATSGPAMTARQMVAVVKQLAAGWEYDAIGMGYPGPVDGNKPSSEPHNLGAGWKGFDFEDAFDKPVRLVNDAMMQAIGSYEGGRMLFLGLGTGLGAAMVAENVCLPMELAHLPYRKGNTFEDYLGERGLDERGKSKWRESVFDVVEKVRSALQPDYIVIGGGNVDKLKELPPLCRRGANENAFRGGFRLWLDDRLVVRY